MNWLKWLYKRRKLLLVPVAAVVALLLFDPFGWNAPAPQPMTLTDLRTHLTKTHDITEGEIRSADHQADVTLADGQKFTVTLPDGYDVDLANQFLNANIHQAKATRPGWASSTFGWILPIAGFWLLLFGVPTIFTRLTRGGSSKPVERPDTKLADVAGMPEIVEEVQFIIDFLRNPERWHKAGAVPPKGVLLYGPPGGGKTLLARAVAGEAGVPFYEISGSAFVEMYVGVGASRVRKFFRSGSSSRLARLMSDKVDEPRILFIDELDAVGGHRTGGGGGHQEHDQTVAQLLTEMDGFVETNVIVIAATNRPNHLDPALRRPGRFDREIPVPLPDLKGREDILKIHTRKKPLRPDLDLRDVARKTPGFSGAELKSLANQASVTMMARIPKDQDVDELTLEDFQNALTTILLGPARKNAEVMEHDRDITARHEAGHTIVAMAQEEVPDPSQVSVIPRGMAGGVTMMTPGDEQLKRRSRFRAELAGMLGGRAAEIIALEKDFTQGASSDLENATSVAWSYVAEYGLYDGIRANLDSEGWSEARTAQVEAAVEDLLERAETLAVTLLLGYRAVFDELTADLIANETVSGERLQEHYRPLIDAVQQKVTSVTV